MARRSDSSFDDVRRGVLALYDALDNGEVKPVYLFSGDDAYQREAVVRRVVGKLVPTDSRDSALTVLEAPEAGVRGVVSALESSGFRFGDEPRQVVLVRNAPWFGAAKAEESQPLVQRLEGGLPDDMTVIFEVRGKINKSLKTVKLAGTMGVALDFPKLGSEQDVERFLAARVRRAGKRFAPGAVATLTQRAGFEAQPLVLETDKLIAYVGDDDTITSEDVREMVAPTVELSVFDLVDAVAERKPREALAQLAGLLDQQAEPFMILAMLIRQFRLLLQARHLLDAGIADAAILRLRPYDLGQRLDSRSSRSLRDEWREKTAGVLPSEGRQSLLTQHYYPLWKTLSLARRMPAAQLEAALERLLQTDLALKSSHLTPRQEMELLVADLCTRMDEGMTIDVTTLLQP